MTYTLIQSVAESCTELLDDQPEISEVEEKTDALKITSLNKTNVNYFFIQIQNLMKTNIQIFF